MGGLDLLPALGRALKSVAVLSCSVVPVLPGASGPGHQASSGPRGRACRPPPGPAAVDGPDSVAPRDSAPRSPASTGETPVIRRHGLWSPRRTANGSRPRAPWARLTTIPAAKWPVQTGSPCRSGHMSAPAEAAFHLVPTRDVQELFPGGRKPSGPAPTVPLPSPSQRESGGAGRRLSRTPIRSRRGGADEGADDRQECDVRIGIQASYSGGFQQTATEIRDLEAAGLDVALVSEVYTFDAVSQLGYLAAVTERVELMSAIF